MSSVTNDLPLWTAVDGDDGIRDLVLDVAGRPFNVLHKDVVAGLMHALQAAWADAQVVGIVLRSAKPDFVVGADLKELWGWMALPAAEQGRTAAGLSEAFRALEQGGKPVGVVLDGKALGGGLELALACHHRVAVDRPGTALGLPEVTLQLLPGAGGTQRVPRLVGLAAALPFLLSGKPVSAATALEMGLVHATAGDAVAARDLLVQRMLAALAADPVAASTQPWDARRARLPGLQPNSAAYQAVFTQHNAAIHSQDGGHQPARRAIAQAVHDGLTATIDRGLAREGALFLGLLAHGAARNVLRTQFFGMRQVARQPDRPKALTPRHLKTLVVVGEDPALTALAGAAAARGVTVHEQPHAAAELCLLSPTAQVDRALLGSDTTVVRLTDTAPAGGELGLHVPTDQDLSAAPVLALVLPTGQTTDRELADLLSLLGAMRWLPVVQAEGTDSVVSQMHRALEGVVAELVAEGVSASRIAAAGREAGLAALPLQGMPEAVAAELPDAPMSSTELANRLLHAVGRSGLAAVQAGAVRRARDVEVAAVVGLGLSPTRGGPLAWASAQGVAEATALLDQIDPPWQG